MSARQIARLALAAACIAWACCILAGRRAAPAYAQDPSRAPIQLRSESVTLPFGDRQFSGTGKWTEIANGRCLLCHSRGMIDTQPPLPLAVWKSEIAKMRSAFGCVVGDDEIDGLAQFFYEQNHRGNAGAGVSSTPRPKSSSEVR